MIKPGNRDTANRRGATEVWGLFSVCARKQPPHIPPTAGNPNEPGNINFQVGLFVVTRILLHSVMRMVYPFLAVFARGMGISLHQISLAVTVRSFSGLSIPFITSQFDRFGRKIGMLVGVFLFVLGSGMVAVWPVFPSFIISISLTFIGMQVFATCMQAYLGDVIPYEQRGKAMVLTDAGWALSFIVAVPIIGLLIGKYGWQTPFPILTGLGLFMLVVMYRVLPSYQIDKSSSVGNQSGFRQIFTSASALFGLGMSLTFSLANESITLMFGVWLEDTFGLTIAALGAIASVIGFAELGAVGLSSSIVDRLGKGRASAIGLIINGLFAVALPWIGGTSIGAAAGCLFFFQLSFQIVFSCTAPLMSEVLPGARAALMGANLAAVSIGRMLGAIIAPFAYGLGYQANAYIALIFNILALIALSRVKISPSDSLDLSRNE